MRRFQSGREDACCTSKAPLENRAAKERWHSSSPPISKAVVSPQKAAAPERQPPPEKRHRPGWPATSARPAASKALPSHPPLLSSIPHPFPKIRPLRLFFSEYMPHYRSKASFHATNQNGINGTYETRETDDKEYSSFFSSPLRPIRPLRPIGVLSNFNYYILTFLFFSRNPLIFLSSRSP